MAAAGRYALCITHIILVRETSLIGAGIFRERRGQTAAVHLSLDFPRWRALATESSASARQRSIGIAVLLTNTGLMNFGFSILIPLLAIHFTGSLGFTAASIGLVLALRQFAQQGLDVLGGMFGDRFGARTAIAIGCFVRAAGFLGIGFSHSLLPLILWAVVSGIGGAFFDASGTAALADLVQPHNRQRAFAASATAGNAGATIGPVVGVALLSVDFLIVSIAATACFVLVGLLTLVFLPASALRDSAGTAGTSASGDGGAHTSLRNTLRVLARDRTFLWMTIFLSGFWFLWAQMNITVPLAAARLGGARFAAIAFALNAGPAILLQYPASRYLSERASSRLLLASSIAVSAIGIGMAFISSSPAIFFAGIGLFALARMLLGPTVNAVTAEIAPAGQLGTYFGFGALSIAFGAGLGQYGGGALYDVALRHGVSALLWGTFAGVGLIAAVGMAWLRLPNPRRSTSKRAPVRSARESELAPVEQPIS